MIVTLCASAAHPHLIRQAAQGLTLEGHVVLAPEPIEHPVSSHVEAVLTKVHEEKIRMCDVVVVIRKPDGSVGESVSREISYAEAVGKPVRSLGEVTEE